VSGRPHLHANIKRRSSSDKADANRIVMQTKNSPNQKCSSPTKLNVSPNRMYLSRCHSASSGTGFNLCAFGFDFEFASGLALLLAPTKTNTAQVETCATNP
jgi:hypothetical protein